MILNLPKPQCTCTFHKHSQHAYHSLVAIQDVIPQGRVFLLSPDNTKPEYMPVPKRTLLYASSLAQCLAALYLPFSVVPIPTSRLKIGDQRVVLRTIVPGMHVVVSKDNRNLKNWEMWSQVLHLFRNCQRYRIHGGTYEHS